MAEKPEAAGAPGQQGCPGGPLAMCRPCPGAGEASKRPLAGGLKSPREGARRSGSLGCRQRAPQSPKGGLAVNGTRFRTLDTGGRGRGLRAGGEGGMLGYRERRQFWVSPLPPSSAGPRGTQDTGLGSTAPPGACPWGLSELGVQTALNKAFLRRPVTSGCKESIQPHRALVRPLFLMSTYCAQSPGTGRDPGLAKGQVSN